MASRLTSAMEEAYASAPSNVVFLHTLELTIPGEANPVRVVVGDEGWPDERTNRIRNSAGVGAIAGSPGRLPDYWSTFGAAHTRQVVGSGIMRVGDVDIDYVDLRFTGTASGEVGIGFDSNTFAGAGENVTASFYVAQIAGDTTPLVRGYMSGRTAANAVAGSASFASSVATSEMVRRTRTLLTEAGAVSLNFYAVFLPQNAGQSYDITLRFGSPHVQPGLVATDPIRTTGAALTLPANTIQLTLETGATVPFQATAFDITPPGYDDDGPTEGTIAIDGVSGELVPLLEAAAVSPGTIRVTYRNYRSDARFEPGEIITGLKIKAASVSGTRVEGAAGFDEVGEQAFPRVVYDIEKYPGLYETQG